jgi:hypothetical protein
MQGMVGGGATAVASEIMEALDQKGTLDVFELVSIVGQSPAVIVPTLDALVKSGEVEITETLADTSVYRLTRPLRRGLHRLA